MSKPTTITRTNVSIRAVCAIAGSYAMASWAALSIARYAPIDKQQAASLGQMVAFLLYPASVIFAFSVRTPARAGIGIALACAVAACPLLMLGGRGA